MIETATRSPHGPFSEQVRHGLQTPVRLNETPRCKGYWKLVSTQLPKLFMDFISFTEAAQGRGAVRSTLYRAVAEGCINAQEEAGRCLVVDDDTFKNYASCNVGRRAARQKEGADE